MEKLLEKKNKKLFFFFEGKPVWGKKKVIQKWAEKVGFQK